MCAVVCIPLHARGREGVGGESGVRASCQELGNFCDQENLTAPWDCHTSRVERVVSLSQGAARDFFLHLLARKRRAFSLVRREFPCRAALYAERNLLFLTNWSKKGASVSRGLDFKIRFTSPPTRATVPKEYRCPILSPHRLLVVPWRVHAVQRERVCGCRGHVGHAAGGAADYLPQ